MRFRHDQVLQKAQQEARRAGEDGEVVYRAVCAGAYDIVGEDAGGGRAGWWTAPGGTHGATLEPDDGVGEDGFEDGGRGVAVCAVGGVVESHDRGTLPVGDEDDFVLCRVAVSVCVGDGDDDVCGAGAFAAVGEDLLEVEFAFAGGGRDFVADVGVLECGDVDEG